MRFKNKCYLIAGGSSGIGLETARILAEKGARVILVSDNVEKLQAALSSLRNDTHFAICCDLSNPDSVPAVFSELRDKHIVLDGMVYCAGIAPLCLLRDNTVELMNRVYSINVMSFIEMVREFYREEISVFGSRIVAVSSITAHAAGYRQTLYGSSKAAMIASVKLMAKELLNREIRINCISPACVESPMLDKLREESTDLDKRMKAVQPLGIISGIGQKLGLLIFRQ